MLSVQLKSAIANNPDKDLSRKVEYLLLSPTYKTVKLHVDCDAIHFDNWYWLCHHYSYAREQIVEFIKFYGELTQNYTNHLWWWSIFECDRAYLVTRGVKNHDEFMISALINGDATKAITPICEVYFKWVVAILKNIKALVTLIGLLEIKLIKVLDGKFI